MLFVKASNSARIHSCKEPKVQKPLDKVSKTGIMTICKTRSNTIYHNEKENVYMKKHNRLLALLLVLCMMLSILPAVSAEETPLATADEVVIYYTNDVHTYINNYEKNKETGKLEVVGMSYDNIADLKAKTAEITDTLLLDAGDHIQGTAYGSMDKGETIVDLMEAAGYDLATLGNHEFDYGMERALEVTQGTVPYVSANFYHEENGVAGESVLDAYKVFDTKNGKIAVIGITTPETFTKSTPAYFQDEEGNYIYGIAGGADGKALYESVQKAINAAAEEADIVIALAHLGDDPASQPWTSEEVIANTTGLDAVIDGHSHSTVPMKKVEDKGGNQVILTQTGEYFGAIGRMSIAKDGTITTSLVEEYAGSDAEVKAIKDAWIEEIDTQLGKVIGKAEVTFANHDADDKRLVRSRETNTGDFAADALYFLFDDMGLDVDVAIMNGGGVRNNAITGDISYKTCKEIHTFGNVACLQTVTGQQLLDALEWGAKSTPAGEHGGFLQVSGLVYTIDASIPSTVQADEKGVWTGRPTGDYRVKDVFVYNKETENWEELDLEAKYNLAGYNYTLRDLGDGFAMFDGAVNVLDYVMEDYMVLANYVEKNWQGEPITAENSPYGSVYGESRITIENPFKDVSPKHWAKEYVDAMYNIGLIKGMTSTTFAPEAKITRAQFATILYRIIGAQAEEYTVEFTDVKKDAWYYDEVMTLAELEIISGNGDGTFAPEKEIKRQEAVKMIYKVMDLIDPIGAVDESVLDAFADEADIDDWAREYMSWAVSVDLIKGYEDNTVRSADNATRSEASALVVRWLISVVEEA